MKKEFSIYEFVGVLVPAVILMVAIYFIYLLAYQEKLVEFDKIGETIVFIVFSYGIGNLLQALGYFLDKKIWKYHKGMPTQWLTTKNRRGKYLFSDKAENEKIKASVRERFGEDIKNYGRLSYNLLFQRGLTLRIDIFNAHYSMFRGLSVTLCFLGIFSAFFVRFHFKFLLISVFSFLLSLLSLHRMISFGISYAREIFQTILNLEEKESQVKD